MDDNYKIKITFPDKQKVAEMESSADIKGKYEAYNLEFQNTLDLYLIETILKFSGVKVEKFLNNKRINEREIDIPCDKNEFKEI